MGRGTALEGRRMFADVAAQMHYGCEIAGTRIGWHQDAINSCLHLALSLQGTRALHHEPRLHGVVIESEEMERAVRESKATFTFEAGEVDWQEEGDFYVSSPWAFYHG